MEKETKTTDLEELKDCSLTLQVKDGKIVFKGNGDKKTLIIALSMVCMGDKQTADIIIKTAASLLESMIDEPGEKEENNQQNIDKKLS